MHEVIVIGGGVIGLSIARRLAPRKSVLLLDRGATGQGTSWAAAGMLSPLSEADDRGPFFQMCLESFRMFRPFVDELRDETGVDPQFSESGLLYLASSDESLKILQGRYEWQHKAGFDVQLLSPEEIRKMEPLITASAPGALFLPHECSVVPRRLVNALRESCLLRGVDIRTGVPVDAVARNAVRAGHTLFEAERIIVASGVWTSSVQGLDPPIALYPRKGQILSLRMPEHAFGRMIRWEHSYFIPRAGGEMIVGATDEDVGFDLSLTVAGVGRLLVEAQQISSHVGAYPILETWTGLRPATRDGLPVIGKSNIPGVIYATGHYRNGILLAPITASIVADLL